MALSLSNLRPAAGSTHKRKRVGRGNSSGHGTYSTRGMKGQKSRSGVSNLKRLGLKKMLLSVPKSRGFKSLELKNIVINLADLNANFKQGDTVNPKTLAAAGLLKYTGAAIKILAQGQLKVAELKVEGVLLSTAAAAAIKENKGTIKN